jgi:FkbM family methyltransferase
MAKRIVQRVLRRLKAEVFPTEGDRAVKRWWKDGGDERFRYDYDLSSDSLIVDLGGYKGQWASDMHGRYGCRVLVFEPVRSFADKITERFKKNPRIQTFCLALGKNRRQETFFLSADGTSAYGDASAKATVQFEDVAEFFRTHDIGEIDLMKVNIEGGEYELLPRILETKLIRNIKHLQIQFHDVAPDSRQRMDEICRALALTHQPTYQYKFVWENWTRRD